MERDRNRPPVFGFILLALAVVGVGYASTAETEAVIDEPGARKAVYTPPEPAPPQAGADATRTRDATLRTLQDG